MKIRIGILIVFGLLGLASAFSLPQLRFSFNFEQFFPEGDKDLEFFRDFTKSFEADDNFLLVAVTRSEGVFDSSFLANFHDFSLRCRELPHATGSQSLTMVGYPLKTPFAITTVPAIHIDQPARYAADRERILRDERFVYNLINKEGTALVIFVKTVSNMTLEQSREQMDALEALMDDYPFEKVHRLGRPYFQRELVAMQIREVLVSAIISGILVSMIMFFIYRRVWGVFVSLLSIGLGMLLFMGFLSATGRELSALAALYPVLMIIVGASDIIHMMTRYVDELRKGKTQEDAIVITLKEIGLATLLTSATTAIGFATLITSRIAPIRDFGINAAIGVIIAYLTAVLFTTSLLSFLRAEQIIKLGERQARWDGWINAIYTFTLTRARAISWGTVVVLAVCAWGISQITTNYSIIRNLPRNRQITEDFKFFERELSGFRPLELAVFIQPGYEASDYAVVREMDKIEGFLRQHSFLQAISSQTLLYKSINQMFSNNRPDAYKLPEDESTFNRYKRLAERAPNPNMNVMVSTDGTKARISSRIQDIGADSIKAFGIRLEQWIGKNVDSSVIRIRQTGTGLIIDKNSEYVRSSLLEGLGLAIVAIGILMALLFKNARMLVIFMIPNVFPLLIAGAILGFLGIELEAGISIIFAVIFGIAVDDTIHFMSRYKLARSGGLGVEEAVKITFEETGKAIVLTTIVLFFGFLVMLFSINPPSVTVGLLISFTLLSALLADLLLLPVLIRWLDKD
jgi:uncharacterized protein